MTELTVQNLVELYKFFATSMRVCIHKFWKVTVLLSISLVFTILLIVYMFARPDCHVPFASSFESCIKITVTLTFSMVLSLVYIIAGVYLNGVQSTACKSQNKIKSIIKDIKKNDVIMIANLKHSDTDNYEKDKDILLGLIDEDDGAACTIGGIMTFVQKFSIGLGVALILLFIIKFIVSCYCQSPMY
jgi:hypothetical protein